MWKWNTITLMKDITMEDKDVRILIVDDEDIVLKSSNRILQKKGYNIDTTYSGKTALEYAEKNPYHIVITDLKMPGMDGMQVLEEFKKRYPETLVIIFTGFATVETARQALKSGAFDYVPKPFTPEELRSVVQNAVNALDNKNEESNMLHLMAIVSHELKSPLSVMQTTAETLYKGYFGNLDSQQQKTVETILRNCQYLEDIIRNYIDLSSMGMDELKSFKEELNFNEDVVLPVIEIPEYNNNIKNMKIETEFSASPVINGDPNLLKIVVTNLLNNAIKYGTKDTIIKVDVKEENGKCLFSVFNRGVGISKEDVEEKLFKKFSRLKQKGTEGVKGSGLGLFICNSMIEKHNGSISVESEPGEWARFIITLPGGQVKG